MINLYVYIDSRVRVLNKMHKNPISYMYFYELGHVYKCSEDNQWLLRTFMHGACYCNVSYTNMYMYVSSHTHLPTGVL